MAELNIPDELPERYKEPLVMLSDCHRRIEKFLQYLLETSESKEIKLEGQNHIDFTKALDYFVGACEIHNADEEISLFPRLKQHPNKNETQDLLELIDSLESQHRYLESIHKQHDLLGRRWLEQQTLNPKDLLQFNELTKNLIEIYTEHISHEDNKVFTKAKEIFTQNELEAIGEEMWDRRGRKHCRKRIDDQKQTQLTR